MFVRHGGNHDWYRNPQSGISQPIARHTEIEDGLAKKNNQETVLGFSEQSYKRWQKP